VHRACPTPTSGSQICGRECSGAVVCAAVVLDTVASWPWPESHRRVSVSVTAARAEGSKHHNVHFLHLIKCRVATMQTGLALRLLVCLTVVLTAAAAPCSEKLPPEAAVGSAVLQGDDLVYHAGVQPGEWQNLHGCCRAWGASRAQHLGRHATSVGVQASWKRWYDHCRAVVKSCKCSPALLHGFMPVVLPSPCCLHRCCGTWSVC